MAKQIKNTDLIEKGVFTPTVKSADELLASLDKLDKGFMKVIKTAKKGLKNTKIVDLKSVEAATKAIKDVDQASKGLTATQKERVKLREKIKVQNSTEIQQNVQLKRQLQEQAKANKDLEITQSKNAGTLQKLAAQSRILRRERERLNLDTAKGRKRLQEINKELDRNNKKVQQNSDKLKKQRLNVGNYSDSIKEAAQASGLFGGVLGKLGQVQGVLNALTKKNTVQQEANTVQKEVAAVSTAKLNVVQRGLNITMGAGTKALRIFKIALASTGIGALLLAVGSLVAFFTRVQGGVDSVSQANAGLTAGLDVLIDRIASASGGFVKLFKGIGTIITSQFKLIGIASDFLSGDFDKAKEKAGDLVKELKEAPSQVIDGINDIQNAFKGIGDELERETQLAFELRKLTITLTREQKLFEAEQAKTLTTIKELTIVSKNKLAVDQERLDAVEEINRLEILTAERQLELQDQALASALDSISADRTRLELGAEQLDFIERIKNGQIDAAEAVQLAADFTLSSAAGEEALFEIIEKVVGQEQAKQSLLDKQASTIRRTASITQEIANKNSKALLQEAKLQQLIAKDEDESTKSRIEAIELVRDLSVQASKVRLDANLINTQEFIAFRLTEEKRAQEAIQALLLKTNETIDKDLEKRIKKQVDTINAIEQEQFNFEIDRLSERIEAEETTQEERLKLIDEANELRKNKLIAQADFELTNEKLITEERELINQSLVNDLANLENDRVDAVKDANEKIIGEDFELQKQRTANAAKTAGDITDIFDESFGEILDKRSAALDEEEARSKDNLTRQEELAAQGVQGAAERAAFERQKQAEIALQQREIEQQRQFEEQAAQLVSTYFNFLDARTGAAETEAEVNAAPGKALQDTAKAAVIGAGAKGLAGLVAGSAFEGTEDTGGAGNLDSKGGKLWLLHPHEGVVNREGNENYSGLVGAMNSGDVDSWMMKNMMIQPNLNFDSRTKEDKIERSYQQLSVEMKGVKKAIENKPVQMIDADGLGNIIEQIIANGSTHTTIHQRVKRKI